MMCGDLLAGTTEDPRVQQRESHQERRIESGVGSGQLTPQETRRLQAEQNKISRDEARMKEDDQLTPQERRKLRREQNKASRDIRRLKHNDRTTPGVQ
ncbi:MAG: hypothetical protein HQM03_08235 [Magnetococcales bacterium]|nr:hypothetical protein [Magnetococcales bacterium]